MDYRRWFRNCIIIFATAILAIFLAVLVVDPYFHYHAPIGKYRLYEPRFTNDGISRNFDFDAVIMGTSMSQNFKPSLADELFGLNTVKMPLVGASYKELSNQAVRVLKRNPNVKAVFWAMDENGLLNPADLMTYELPEYIYDENPLNDAPYIYNKDMLYHALVPDIVLSIAGGESTSMDEYNVSVAPLGIENFYSGHTENGENPENAKKPSLSTDEREEVKKSITSNFAEVVNEYPETTFYIFIPPYSMYWWEHQRGNGDLDRYLEAQRLATELLLECPNVRLYSFWGHHEVIENMDNYRDSTHYSGDICDSILRWIKDDDGLLTKVNYVSEFEAQEEYLHSFDYYGFFEQFE